MRGCGAVTYVENPVAMQHEVNDLQEKLGHAVPTDLQQAFLSFSKDVSFSTFLPDDFALPYALRKVFSAQFVISIDGVLNLSTIGVLVSIRRAKMQGSIDN